MKPSLIKGSVFSDNRGHLKFNNDFNASEIKRIYTIENKDLSVIRAWQGHKIERRWFSALQGKFIIQLIEIDNWESPSKNLEILEFVLSSETLDFLQVPSGFISSIRCLENESKLLVLADYSLGEIDDEYRFPLNYFIREEK